MKKEKTRPVPAIVEFLTFWFGREKTNWKGIQEHWGLSDKQINRLRQQNRAYRGIHYYD